jgi:hypothetical protein
VNLFEPWCIIVTTCAVVAQEDGAPTSQGVSYSEGDSHRSSRVQY